MKAVSCYDFLNNKIHRFDSAKDASKTLNVQQSKISEVINGNRHTANGCLFWYTDDPDPKEKIKELRKLEIKVYRRGNKVMKRASHYAPKTPKVPSIP